MGTESDEIMRHIEEARSHLGSNLNELEYRVKEATDWRRHFQRHRGAFLGAALGGGFLLGLIL